MPRGVGGFEGSAWRVVAVDLKPLAPRKAAGKTGRQGKAVTGFKLHASPQLGERMTMGNRLASAPFSSLERTASNTACLLNRQNIVSVESNEPFSKYLLTGAPPPQYLK